jgi:hypothetical protein
MTGDTYSMDLYAFGPSYAAPTAVEAFARESDGELPAMVDGMSIFTAVSPSELSETSLHQVFYLGDSSPSAIYEFMIQRAPLNAPQDTIWVG